MKIIPEFLKRNLSLKLLSLIIAVVIYFAFRERGPVGTSEISLPSPTGEMSNQPVPVVVVTEKADGSRQSTQGMLLRKAEAPLIPPAPDAATKGSTNAVQTTR